MTLVRGRTQNILLDIVVKVQYCTNPTVLKESPQKGPICNHSHFTEGETKAQKA